MTEIATQLTEIQKNIDTAAQRDNRSQQDVTLVAVSKRQSEDRIEAALKAGQRVFGENRLQEAQSHWAERKQNIEGLKLHLIGALQSNKAAEAVGLFDVIETIDREKIARALAAEMDKQGKRPDCFIQINTGKEPQKSGVLPEEFDALLKLCRDELKLPVVGLMAIPPAHENPAPHFAFLRKLAKKHGLSQISMGMSEDYQTAIHFGATHIRVGSALFGARES